MTGRSILLAGATGGLGSELAHLWADERLTLVARSDEALGALGLADANPLALDLRTPEACRAAVDEAWSFGGERLDVVVNAVGVVAFGSVGELDVDVLEELFLTNTFLTVFLAKAALRRLGDGGTLVNISGVIAEQNLPGMAAYGASKAAIRSFDEALAREARRKGIRVLDARPPHTETGLAGRAIAGKAPKMPEGLAPADVARRIAQAVEDGERDLPSAAFA